MLKFILPALLLLFLFSFKIVSEPHHSPSGRSKISTCTDTSKNNRYCWLSFYDPRHAMVNRIQPPQGFVRVPAEKNSFADWLRHLPLKETNAPVKLYNGNPKGRQDVHAAIIDMDPGSEDLQQCADACMRLKAEYHYSRGEDSKIHFKFSSGHTAAWTQWKEGFRPVINGNNVSWVKKAAADGSYKNFQSYLKTVFRYAGSNSLSQELKDVTTPAEIRPGDIFIKGGFPGHAVMVADVAENKITREKIFLIAQSYMPAQEMHILKNFNNKTLSPWYTINFSEELETPEWTFYGNCLKRFP